MNISINITICIINLMKLFRRHWALSNKCNWNVLIKISIPCHDMMVLNSIRQLLLHWYEVLCIRNTCIIVHSIIRQSFRASRHLENSQKSMCLLKHFLSFFPLSRPINHFLILFNKNSWAFLARKAQPI